MARRLDYDHQRLVILQLSKDRKNAVGGFSGGVMNLEELGAIEGGHVPFTAEWIKRAFGVPKDKNDPNSEYVLTKEAHSHAILEQTIQEYLKPYAPNQYRAYNAVFHPDVSGDRDYEYLKEKAKETTNHGNLARQMLVLVDMALDLLTMRLWDVDLFVKFAEPPTVREDAQKAARDKEIYEEFCELRDLGKKPQKAKEVLATRHGLGTRRVEQIVEDERIRLGNSPRPQGRPKGSEKSLAE